MASYFQSPQGINDIPQFLSAGSPRGLRRLMFRNNLKHKGFVKYFDIQWVPGDKRWYAWFFVTEKAQEVLEDVNATETE